MRWEVEIIAPDTLGLQLAAFCHNNSIGNEWQHVAVPAREPLKSAAALRNMSGKRQSFATGALPAAKAACTPQGPLQWGPVGPH